MTKNPLKVTGSKNQAVNLLMSDLLITIGRNSGIYPICLTPTTNFTDSASDWSH